MMPRTEREELLSRIEAEEARLANLDEQRSEVENRLTELKRQLKSQGELSRRIAVTTPAESQNSNEAKIALFRDLFRGRADVFPTRWQNQRKNTSGYSPACSNEWVREGCEKPRVKCGECPNQAFIPVSDRAVLDHLQGRHTMGVYPLLDDNRCWFVAADFDKRDWQDDVKAFRQWESKTPGHPERFMTRGVEATTELQVGAEICVRGSETRTEPLEQ